ncbi:MAG: hypothetical protein VZS44_09545 [Bacilli bacterium]|nr:hypothetical protein [Bacilli bacterium]
MFDIGTVVQDKVTGQKGIVVSNETNMPDTMYVLIRNKEIYNTLETRITNWRNIGYFSVFEEIIDRLK